MQGIVEKGMYFAKNQFYQIIKNLIAELERKVGRIIAFEKSYIQSQGKPKFRQRILDIYNYLEKELILESVQSVPEQIASAGPSDT